MSVNELMRRYSSPVAATARPPPSAPGGGASGETSRCRGGARRSRWRGRRERRGIGGDGARAGFACGLAVAFIVVASVSQWVLPSVSSNAGGLHFRVLCFLVLSFGDRSGARPPAVPRGEHGGEAEEPQVRAGRRHE